MNETFEQLKKRLSQVRDLQMAGAVLGWDRETFMPSGGSPARARQLSTLNRISHELFVADEVGQWLEELAPFEAELDFASNEASIIRVMRREYRKKRRVPSDLVARIAEASSLGQQKWQQARQASDFAMFQPNLEELIDLRIEWAECFDYEDSIYDPMLDEFESGLTTAQVKAIFDEFRPPLVELVAAIAERKEAVDASCLTGNFDLDVQKALGREILEIMDYDFDRGRIDEVAHPFCTSFSVDDVRVTTRYNPNDLASALFSTMHEGGHGLYELGVSKTLDETPLGGGSSMVIHESQSRLYENLVGRSRPFWRFFYPKLRAKFPYFNDIDLETFYRAVNQVRPSLIRIEADEVTYGLHIILRFEIEQALVTGKIKVADLPDIWNAKMESYLGVCPPNDALGVLQDVHWSYSLIGYFPAYLLGSMLSVQFFEAAQADLPNLMADVESGRLGELRSWLEEKIHQHGSKFTLNEMTQRVLGGSLSPQPYLRYLRERYGEIYGL